MRLALLQYQVRRHDTLAAWEGRVRHPGGGGGAGRGRTPRPARIREQGTPCPAPLPSLAAELDAACAHHDAVLGIMRRSAATHGVWLLGGSLLHRRPDGTRVNHAPLIAPDGRLAFQDKHTPIPFERAQMGVVPGAPPSVFDTPWGRAGRVHLL